MDKNIPHPVVCSAVFLFFLTKTMLQIRHNEIHNLLKVLWRALNGINTFLCQSGDIP